VLRAVYFPVGAVLGFGLGVRLALWRGSGHASLICPRGIGTVGFKPGLPLFVLPRADDPRWDGFTLALAAFPAFAFPFLLPEGSEPFSGIAAAAAGQGDPCAFDVSRTLRGTVVGSAVGERFPAGVRCGQRPSWC
jgi:hypothetical protein